MLLWNVDRPQMSCYLSKFLIFNLCIAHFDRWLNFINNVYRPLRVTTLENAALAGIMLWNSSALPPPSCLFEYSFQVNQFTDNKFAEKRDALYGELNALAIQNALSHFDQQQSIAVPTRFGQMLNLIREISVWKWPKFGRIFFPFRLVFEQRFERIVIVKQSFPGCGQFNGLHQLLGRYIFELKAATKKR